MSYENLDLVVASVSGDVYLAKATNGIMDTDKRRVMTDNVLRAATEWFAVNKKKAIQFQADEDGRHSLFYTKDPEKAERILEILKEKGTDILIK